MKSLLRLFKAVEIEEKKICEKDSLYIDIIRQTISRGFIFSPNVISSFDSHTDVAELIVLIEKEFCLTPEQMNSSFHKSWSKVRDADIEQLVIEQIIHYFTTYGLERLGLYNEDHIYIPNEKLKLPSIELDDIKLTVIKGLTKEEIKEKVVGLLSSGIALSKDTIKDVLDIVNDIDLNKGEVNAVKNKEVRIALYKKYELFPENPEEFLRYIIYLLTGKTLLIKDRDTIESIRTAVSETHVDILKLFIQYEKTVGLENLAKIFYRHKSLFLAFKIFSEPNINYFINKIRRLAKKHHKPMKSDYLNEVTSKLKNKETIDLREFEDKLEKVNTFRKIRLAYALKYRTGDVDSILYKIRNGKGFAADFSFDDKKTANVLLGFVLDSIVFKLREKVKGKKVFIPDYITYALPATEKQFTGNFPSGTCITAPLDMIFGVYWENTVKRVDLDLSLINNTKAKIGWDGIYRNEQKTILFSGDMTDASKGASELFYIKRCNQEEFIVFLNYFNHGYELHHHVDDDSVPFKIVVGQEKVDHMDRHYMIDPNNVLSIVPSIINKKQKVLGLVKTTDSECKFYFSEVNLGNSITSYGSKFVKQTRDYLSNFYTNPISLNNLLLRAGGEITGSKEDKYDIDLSPENIDKVDFINLLT